MKIALCLDEQGIEQEIECNNIDDVPEEWTFRYWQDSPADRAYRRRLDQVVRGFPDDIDHWT